MFRWKVSYRFLHRLLYFLFGEKNNHSVCFTYTAHLYFVNIKAHNLYIYIVFFWVLFHFFFSQCFFSQTILRHIFTKLHQSRNAFFVLQRATINLLKLLLPFYIYLFILFSIRFIFFLLLILLLILNGGFRYIFAIYSYFSCPSVYAHIKCVCVFKFIKWAMKEKRVKFALYWSRRYRLATCIAAEKYANKFINIIMVNGDALDKRYSHS